MKVYDLQWFTTFGMEYDEAAAALVADGIDTVLTQNQIDPLPQSGVDQSEYLAAYQARLASYDDSAWIAALRSHGLKVFETSAVLFEPAALAQFPDARPIDARGQPDTGVDWYTGICPTHEGYLSAKIALLQRVARELEPDGIFLQFIRYPGFWENWTLDPDYLFTAADRFCFCDRCRSLFANEKNLTLSGDTISAQARYILDLHGDAWDAWRQSRITNLVAQVRETVQQHSASMMLNTLPFPRSDFGGQDVRGRVAAQHIGSLARHVERFELMTYLQILNRPVGWLREVIADARSQLPQNRELVCTLQVDALYTDGMHASRRRAKQVTSEDLHYAAFAALDAGADGLVFYHWTDFLTDEAGGGSKRCVLQSVTGV
jgi:hypothetical protein